MKSPGPKKNHFLFITSGFIFLLIMIFFTASPPSYSAEILSNKLIKIETRTGVTQKFILIKPVSPEAAVILFVDGKAKLKLGSSLSGDPTVKRGTYFLARTRKDLARHGLVVVLVDAPSDMAAEKKGMATFSRKTKKLFRMSDEHLQDIKAVVNYLKNQMDIPVWLVGTSMGAISAARGGLSMEDGIAGLVLVSPVTRTRNTWRMRKTHPNGVLDIDLDKIKVPTLVASHQNDKCDVTPASDAAKIEAALVNSSKAEVAYFTGGKGEKGEPCTPLSASGFYGIEDQVVTVIANFIKESAKME